MSSFVQDILALVSRCRSSTPQALGDRLRREHNINLEPVEVSDIDGERLLGGIQCNGIILVDQKVLPDMRPSPDSALQDLFLINTSPAGVGMFGRAVENSAFIWLGNPRNVEPSPIFLDRSRISEVVFYGINMNGTSGFLAKLEDVLLHNCELNYCRLVDYSLSGKLQITYSKDRPLEQRTVSRSVFRSEKSPDGGCHIFRRVCFNNCSFFGLKSVHFDKTYFKSCTLGDCVIRQDSAPLSLIMNDCCLKDVGIEGIRGDVYLEDIQSKGSNGSRVTFSECILDNLYLTGSSESTGENMPELNLINCIVKGTCRVDNCVIKTIDGCKFEGEQNRFSGCRIDLEKVDTSVFSGSVFDLTGSDLYYIEYDKSSMLSSVDFSNCILDKTAFRNVLFNQCTFSERDDVIPDGSCCAYFVDCKFDGLSGAYSWYDFEDCEFNASAKRKEVHTFERCHHNKSTFFQQAGPLQFRGDNCEKSLIENSMFKGEADNEWHLSFQKCEIAACVFEKIRFPRRRMIDKEIFNRCRISEGTSFEGCSFDEALILRSSIEELIIREWLGSDNNIRVEESAIFDFNICKSHSSKLHLSLDGCELSQSVRMSLARSYQNDEVKLYGKAWWEKSQCKSEKVFPLERMGERPYLLWKHGRPMPALFHIVDKPMKKLRHCDTDIEIDPNPLMIRELLKEVESINFELNDLKSVMLEYNSYRNRLTQLRKSFKDLIRAIDENEMQELIACKKALKSSLRSWRESLVLRLSEVNSDTEETLAKWLKRIGQRVFRDIKSTYGENIEIKLYNDFLGLEKILKIVALNIQRHSENEYGYAEYNLVNNCWELIVGDQGRGFPEQAAIGLWKESQWRVFHKYCKWWTTEAKLYTKCIQDETCKIIDLRSSSEDPVQERKDEDLPRRIREKTLGTAFYFLFERPDLSKITKGNKNIGENRRPAEGRKEN